MGCFGVRGCVGLSNSAVGRIALVDFLEKELGVGCAQTPKEAIEMAAALLAGYAAGTAAP